MPLSENPNNTANLEISAKQGLFGDAPFTSLFSLGKTLLKIGSNLVYKVSNQLLGIEIKIDRDHTGISNKTCVGISTIINNRGSGSNNGVIGNFVFINNQGDTSGNSGLTGVSSSINLQYPTNEATAGEFGNGIGSGNANGTGVIKGVRSALTVNYNNGVAKEAIGNEITLTTTGSGNATAPLVTGIKIKNQSFNPSASINNFFGLKFEGFSGNINNGYLIHCDNSVDSYPNLYFIYSQTKQPSFFAGKFVFDRNPKPYPIGNSTINKPLFTFKMPTGNTSAIITNSFITNESVVFATIKDSNSGIYVKNIDTTAGQCTINLSAPPTADLELTCLVVN